MINHQGLKSAPSLGQFAKQDAWEQAWAFEHTRCPCNAEVESYVASSREAAFEAFFGEAFFGMRFSGEPDRVRALSTGALAAFRAAHNATEFFERLSETTGLRHFGKEMLFAEIGAVNAWRSVGTFKIELSMLRPGHFDTFWAKLLAAPVATHTGHRKALEFAFADPLPHWIAFPVSGSTAPFELDKQLVQDTLSRMLPIRLA